MPEENWYSSGPPAGGELQMDLILPLSIDVIAGEVVITLGVLVLKKRTGES